MTTLNLIVVVAPLSAVYDERLMICTAVVVAAIQHEFAASAEPVLHADPLSLNI